MDREISLLERAQKAAPDDQNIIRRLLAAYDRSGHEKPYGLLSQESELHTPCGRNAQGMEEFRHKTTGMMFVLIPSGSFQMGAADDQHERTFSEPFLMAKYPWTANEWYRVAGETPSHFPTEEMVSAVHPGGPSVAHDHTRLNLPDQHGKTWGDHPVESVSWDRCQEVTDWINRIDFARRFNAPFTTSTEAPCWKTWREYEYGNDARGFAPATRHSDGEVVVPHFGKLIFPDGVEQLYEAWLWNSRGERCGFHIPTESMWEYATRAGATTRYPNGDSEEDLHEIAWFGGEWAEGHKAVGLKKPNNWGLHDNCGNVFEWTRCRWRQSISEGEGNGFLATGESRRDLTASPFVNDESIRSAVESITGKGIFTLPVEVKVPQAEEHDGGPTTASAALAGPQTPTTDQGPVQSQSTSSTLPATPSDAPQGSGDGPFESPGQSTPTSLEEGTSPGSDTSTQGSSTTPTFPRIEPLSSLILPTFPSDEVSAQEHSSQVTPPEATCGSSGPSVSEPFLGDVSEGGSDQNSESVQDGERGDHPFSQTGWSTPIPLLREGHPDSSSVIEETQSSTQDSSSLPTSPFTPLRSIQEDLFSVEPPGSPIGPRPLSTTTPTATRQMPARTSGSGRPGERGADPFGGSVSLSSSNYSASRTSSTRELVDPPLIGSLRDPGSLGRTTLSGVADPATSRSLTEALLTRALATMRQESEGPGERGDRSTLPPFFGTASPSSPGLTERSTTHDTNPSSASSPCPVQSEASPSTGRVTDPPCGPTEALTGPTIQHQSHTVQAPDQTHSPVVELVPAGERGDVPFVSRVGSESATSSSTPESTHELFGNRSSTTQTECTETPYSPTTLSPSATSECVNQRSQSEASPGSATQLARTSETLTTSTRRGTTAAPGLLGDVGDDPFVGAHRQSTDGPNTQRALIHLPSSSFPSSDEHGRDSSPQTSLASTSGSAQEIAGMPLPTSDGRADDTGQNTIAAPESAPAGGLEEWVRRICGVSSRGHVSIDQSSGVIDPDTFTLHAFDLVADPPVMNAYVWYGGEETGELVIMGGQWTTPAYAFRNAFLDPPPDTFICRRQRLSRDDSISIASIWHLACGARASWRSRN